MSKVTAVPFGLFRRKESETPAELPAIELPATSSLSIQQAQELLRNIEAAKVQELAARLLPIKESALKSLGVISSLANDMEQEKIKFEGIEHRFKSVAENSRRTVVSSLRREAATELMLPQSANDAKKFKEKFETMMNRLSEVSGSHSRVITAFMKKHANKMSDEFDSLKKLLNETKTIMSDFEQRRTPVVRCGGILNTASQKVSSIRAGETSVQNLMQEIERIENELKTSKTELDSLRTSPEFERSAVTVQKADEAERQKEQFHADLTDLFSHVSRAFTKYSYGLTKDTEARLHMMTDEPWRILYESDMLPYTSVLVEIHKSIGSGRIQLKDSEKILSYLDTILTSMPEFRNKEQALRDEVESLRKTDSGLVGKAKELGERILQREEELAKNKQYLELQKRQIAEKNEDVASLLKEVSNILTNLTAQKYSLVY